MSRCDIIIPVWNQPDVTRDCLDSIFKHSDYPYRLIIIDNASEAETSDYLRSLKATKGISDIELIRNEQNLGFIKAVNQGIKKSDAPYVCIMNNDTIATSGWLKEMVGVMDRYPGIGLLNPSSNTSGQFPEKKKLIDQYALSLRRLNGQIQELYTCRGFCMLVRRTVLERLGPMDEGYHMGYFDDTDYCKKAQGAGYGTARAKAAYVYHLENTSFKELKNNGELFIVNERIFFGRWGRPLRVGYFAQAPAVTAPEKIDDIATHVARSGHQIVIFTDKKSRWPVRVDHFDIRRVDLPRPLFGLISIYKILKRKKKKPIHMLLTDDALFGAILKLIRPLHGADVFINPDKPAVLETLRRKSMDL